MKVFKPSAGGRVARNTDFVLINLRNHGKTGLQLSVHIPQPIMARMRWVTGDRVLVIERNGQMELQRSNEGYTLSGGGKKFLGSCRSAELRLAATDEVLQAFKHFDGTAHRPKANGFTLTMDHTTIAAVTPTQKDAQP